MKKTFKKVSLMVLSVIFAITLCCGIFLGLKGSVEASAISAINEAEAAADQIKEDRYISDLPNSYVIPGFPVGVVKDQTDKGGRLAVNAGSNGASTYFSKGLFIPIDKRIVYNISNLDYTYFYCCAGVQSGTNADGKVDFSIELSNSATGGWINKFYASEMSSKESAKRVLVRLDNYSYMRISANFPSGMRNSVNTILADAKFTDNDKTDISYSVKSVSEYDSLIKGKYANADLSDEEYELAVLQRNYVSKFGNNGNVYLHNFSLLDDASGETFDWLFNNLDVLRMYTTAGMPDNCDMYNKGSNVYNMKSWKNSLSILTQLYSTYKEDLEDDSLSPLGNKRSLIYQKMMMSVSLTFTRRIRFWFYDMGPNMEFNTSDNDATPLARYAAFKKLWLAGKLDNNTFERLEVEEMRYVVNTLLPDNEIEWLLDYWKWRGTKGPYNLMVYRRVDELWDRTPQYYDPAKKDYWYQKYRLDGYGIEYKKYTTHAWMVIDAGGVCWNMSNMASNMTAVWGRPSMPLGQDGKMLHLAYIDYSKNANGDGVWSLSNDVYGWVNTHLRSYNNLGGNGGYYYSRGMCDWGTGSYASQFNGTYVFLSQAAINDFENYETAYKLNTLAGIYADNLSRQEQIYRQAISAQKINLDSWLGLINNYVAQGKSGEEFVELARELADALKYYPLPMVDMLRLIGKYASATEYKAVLNMIQVENLTKATTATEAQVLQSGVTRLMARNLLGKTDKEVAKFAFDNDGGGKLSLGSLYENSEAAWEYSLDGGAKWTQTTEKSVSLTPAETAVLSADTDIKVHIIGTPRTDANTFVIDITVSNAPTGFYVNDWENKIFGIDNTMEWRLDNRQEWTKYSVRQPDLSGDKTLYVRRLPSGTALHSDAAVYTLTSTGENNPAKKYISISHLSVKGVSSQATQYAGDAVNVIDGNYNTRWHSDWNGNDTKRYIIIEFDKPYVLTAMDYVPAGGGNGKILKGRIYGSGDGQYWSELAYVNWAQNDDIKTAEFLNNDLKVRYVKIVGEKCSGSKSFITGRMFNFYHNEDATADVRPTADVLYSTKAKTNQDVTVQLVNPSTAITVKNNQSTVYTFTENGEFTFEFADANGNTNTRKVVVDWIDKIAPTATATYSTTALTNQDVVVTLSFSETVVINNNGGKNTFTFTSNGEFTFYFSDLVGNQSTFTATVENIFKGKPTYISLKYSTVEPTNGSVFLTITFDRPVKRTNESAKPFSTIYTCEIKNNIEQTPYQFTDELGNKCTIPVKVSWIDKTAPIGTISYSTTAAANKVVAYITFNEENVTITNNNGAGSYTFTENGSFKFEFVDRAGNKGSATAKVTNIDKNVAAPEIVYDIDTFTNQNVTASLVVGGEVVDTHMFEANGTYKFETTVAGNAVSATAFVGWIDKTVPEATVSYNSTRWSRFGNITATVTFNESDVEITNNGGSKDYLFEENGSFVFEYRDKAGNTGTATAEVYWIYKSIPTAVITYSKTEKTNQDVTVTINGYERPADVDEKTFGYYKQTISITNNFGSNRYVFTQNGTFDFEIGDGAGNKENVTVVVDWIDKAAPMGSFTYSTYDVTRDAVTAEISFDKQNVTITNNGGSNSLQFNDNGSFTFEFADELGNTGTATAVVSWIDKNLPKATVSFDVTVKTAQDVTATISFDIDGVVILNNEGNNAYTFTENGYFTFEYSYDGDKFASETVEVNWIKKNITIKYLGSDELIKQDVIDFGSNYILTLPDDYAGREVSYWVCNDTTYYTGDIVSLDDDLTLAAVFVTRDPEEGKNPDEGKDPDESKEPDDGKDPDESKHPDEGKDPSADKDTTENDAPVVEGKSNGSAVIIGIVCGVVGALAVAVVAVAVIIVLKRKK